MLCYFLLYILVNQLCTYILCLWSLPPPSITPLQVLTEHRVELPVIYSSFLLSIYGSICSYSLFVPLSPSPSVSKSSFSMIASLFLPCRSIHQYHFSRFHRYHIPSHRNHINIWYLFFSFWHASPCMTDPESVCIATNEWILFIFYCRVIFHCTGEYHLNWGTLIKYIVLCNVGGPSSIRWRP